MNPINISEKSSKYKYFRPIQFNDYNYVLKLKYLRFWNGPYQKLKEIKLIQIRKKLHVNKIKK